LAIRKLRIEGDEILRKKSRKVEKIDDRLKILLDDMVETMYQNDGIGLAAVQVGVLKRAIVMDIGEGPFKILNPKIIEKSGEQVFTEGCLSVPGIYSTVRRSSLITVEAMDLDEKKIQITQEGFLAIVLQHEIDHLEGKLILDHADGAIYIPKEKRVILMALLQRELPIEEREIVPA